MAVEEKKTPKFNIGDRVTVVKYGHMVGGIKDGKGVWMDLYPEIIGRTGFVESITPHPNPNYQFGIQFDDGSYVAWLNPGQLESAEVKSEDSLRAELSKQADLINELMYCIEHPSCSNEAWKKSIIKTARERGYGFKESK